MIQDASIINPAEQAVFNSAKMGKATLFASPRMLVGLNCFEPGQEHKLHTHHEMDKIYQVLTGRGLLLLDDREEPIEAGQLLTAPAGVAHGIRNTGEHRLLLLAILAPGP